MEKAVTTRGREFLEFGRRSSAGMNFGPPAAELSPLLSTWVNSATELQRGRDKDLNSHWMDEGENVSER